MFSAFVSFSSAARLHKARHWLAQCVQDDPIRGAVIIAPTKRAADDFARSQPGEGMIGVHRLSTTQLGITLAAPSLAAASQTAAGALALEAVVYRAIAQSKNELESLQEIAQFPGFARALTRTLTDLRADGWSAETTRGAVSNFAPTSFV